MTDRRGAALRESKAASQVARIEKIKSILSGIKGIEFSNFTTLSEYVAERFSIEFDEVINSSTLRRNKSYKHLLVQFVNKIQQPINEISKLNEELIIERSENYELSRQNSALKKELSVTLSKIASIQQERLLSHTSGETDKISKSEIKAFTLVLTLVRHIGHVSVDPSGIYDNATVGEPELIVSFDQCPHFFEWQFGDNKIL